jgi:DNA-binding NarL/FixJ family response regulator
MRNKLRAKDMSPVAWEKLRRLSKVRQSDILKSQKMKLKEQRFIQMQSLKEVNGSSGAYERWVAQHGRSIQKGKLGDRFDFVTEDIRANPDSLREDEAMYASSQMTGPQELMGDAIEHLQGRQREVYLLTMREGLSIAQAAEKLSISKGTAQTHRDRAIKFVRAFCKAGLI